MKFTYRPAIGIASLSTSIFLSGIGDASQHQGSTDGTNLIARARAIHAETPLIDGHNDLPWQLRTRAARDFERLDLSSAQPALQTDIPRLRAAGLGAQFWSAYIPPDSPNGVTATLEQIDLIHRLVQRYPDSFEAATTADDIERAFTRHKIASLIGIEGGHSIANSLVVLRMFHQLGVRYMTLTHALNTDWADSATDTPRHNGLSPFGEQVIREMNQLGTLVDLSHTSVDTMKHAIRIAAAPVIFSHSAARSLNDIRRNVPDEVLRLLPKNGGIVMLTFTPDHISAPLVGWNRRRTAERQRLQLQLGLDQPATNKSLAAWMATNPVPRVRLAEVVDHIDHIRKIAGGEHIGLGGDFEGMVVGPESLEDVSGYPALTAEMLRRGYAERDIKKILGLNMLRVMRASETAAARLQSTAR